MDPHFERRDGAFTISTDPQRLDAHAVHAYLSGESYWAAGIPFDVVRRALDNSLCFGLYHDTRGQVGLARVVTDRATFAWLCDVYVLPEFRGAGLGKWLMRCVMEHPSLQGLRRFMLRTKDAHDLYRPLGFADATEIGKLMELTNRNVYKAAP